MNHKIVLSQLHWPFQLTPLVCDFRVDLEVTCDVSDSSFPHLAQTTLLPHRKAGKEHTQNQSLSLLFSCPSVCTLHCCPIICRPNSPEHRHRCPSASFRIRRCISESLILLFWYCLGSYLKQTWFCMTKEKRNARTIAVNILIFNVAILPSHLYIQ